MQTSLLRGLSGSAVALLLAVPCLAQSPRHLFLDPTAISEMDHAVLRVNPPRAGEVVLRPDQPWEQESIGAFSTLREEDGLLRLWYCCKDRAGRHFMAYAESRDGLVWAKPNLGVFDYNGSRANNIVLEDFWEGTPFLDPHATRPEEKYSYVGHGEAKGVYHFTSPDGLRWKRDPQPLLPFRVDTHDVTFWDQRLGCYVLYLRGWNVPGAWDQRMRKIVRLTLSTLSEPAALKPSGRGSNPINPKDLPRVVDEIPTVLTTDQLDPANTDVYNMEAQPYPLDPTWYVAFPSFFRRSSLVEGRLEVQFVGGHDGIVWHRYDHRAYVAPGLAGSDSSNRTYMGTGLVVRGDELWQYGISYWSTHAGLSGRQPEAPGPDGKKIPARMLPSDGVLRRYVQRIDGFVSLDFDLEGGKARLVPVTINGPHLRLNVDTGALGDIRIALRDAQGQPVQGFGADDSDPIQANSTGAVVSWKGHSDLSALVGTRVEVEVLGRRAKLYSFYFN